MDRASKDEISKLIKQGHKLFEQLDLLVHLVTHGVSMMLSIDNNGTSKDNETSSCFTSLTPRGNAVTRRVNPQPHLCSVAFHGSNVEVAKPTR